MAARSLLGREAVLAQMSDALAGGAELGPALLLVGERGIGRTACLDHARCEAHRLGHLVVETAGSEAERELPYAGLHRLLQPVVDAAEALSPVHRRALLTALGLRDSSEAPQLLIFVAAVDLLKHVAGRRRIVVLADDVQWLDPQTQSALAFIARRLADTGAVLATSSPRPIAPFVDAFREIALDRLDEFNARRLLAAHAPLLNTARQDWVLELAAGNPLAVLHLATAAAATDVLTADPTTRWTVPPVLQRAFAGAIDDLSECAGDAALVAAVAMDAQLPEVLAATSLLCGRRVRTTAIDQAEDAGLLRVVGNRVHFTHPLARAAIVQRVSVSRRQAAHRALGEVITLSAERRTWHRANGASGYDDEVAAELEAGAAMSLRRGAADLAIAAWERAAQLSSRPIDRGRRLVGGACLAARMGRPDEVDALLEACAGGPLTHLDRARAELLREDFDGAVVVEGTRMRRLCAAARRAAAAGDVPLALELAEAAARRRCAGPVDDDVLADLTDLVRVLGAASGRSGDPRALVVLALADPVRHGRAVLAALDVGSTTLVDVDRQCAAAVAARAVGDYCTAIRLFDEVAPILSARGFLGPLSRNLAVAADIRLELGQWAGAQADLARFRPLSARCMSQSHRTSAQVTAAKLAALRGDAVTAFNLVAELEHSSAAHTGGRFLARARAVLGIACIATGEHSSAVDILARLLDPGDPGHHFREQFDAVAYLAEAAARCGRGDEVQPMVDRLRDVAATCGSPMLSAHLAYADAVLEVDNDAAEAAFVSALAGGSGGSAWHRARTQLAYGRWLRRRYRVIESRGPLGAAADALDRMGAGPWAAEARDEQKAAGASGAAEASTVVADLLSPQEQRIADLVAEGLSNKEIGSRMCLSARTVSSHLYRIFPKLGITSRTQLAARLEQSGLNR